MAWARAERRPIARQLASALIQRADMLMYEAKAERASHIHLVRARIVAGALVEIAEDEATAILSRD